MSSTTTTERPQLTEAQKQKTAEHLVRREVIHCVSSMVSETYKAHEALEIPFEDFAAIMTQDDYTTPAAYHARDEGTTDDARWMAEDIVTDHDERLEELAGQLDIADDGDTAATPGEIEAARKEMRELMADVLDQDPDAAREYCDRNNIEPYQNEAYEHWAVSSWFAGKLAERGEMTGELFDFYIWGRCTTGQAIDMDSVIQSIALELWPEGWTE